MYFFFYILTSFLFLGIQGSLQKFEQRTGEFWKKVFLLKLYLILQIEATFRKFDQTGNEKLNLKEFSDMMSKRSETTKKKTETLNKDQDNNWS